jgi:hypothetical protein
MATSILGNDWLASDRLWHMKNLGQAALAAWSIALAGSWHLSVSAPLSAIPFLSHHATITILTGELGGPWNLLTAELILTAGLVARRQHSMNPLLLGAAVFAMTMAVEVLNATLISHISGVSLAGATVHQLTGVRVQPDITAQPDFSLSWVLAAGGAGIAAAWGTMQSSRKIARLPDARLVEFKRVVGASLIALGLAGGASWLVAMVAGLGDPSFAHATAMKAPLWLLGGPAWIVQGLGMASAATMQVRATVVGVGLSEHLGLLGQDHAALGTSLLLAGVTIVSGFIAGRWWCRASTAGLARSWLIGVTFGALLAVLAAGSGFSVSVQLAAGAASLAGGVLGSILGLIPFAGSLLSDLANSLVSAAHSQGVQVRWGVSPIGTLLGGMVLVGLGARAGAASMRAASRVPVTDTSTKVARGRPLPEAEAMASHLDGSVPVPRSWSDRQAATEFDRELPSGSRNLGGTAMPRTVCPLCMAVETGGSANCHQCGARL